MAESSLARYLRTLLGGYDPAIALARVENAVGPGTPDAVYCVRGAVGWIELKTARRWPVRPATRLAVPGFTPQQRVWLRQWISAGGRAFVLLRVGVPGTPTDYLLIDGDTAAWKLGHVPRAELAEVALEQWRGRINAEQLVEALRR